MPLTVTWPVEWCEVMIGCAAMVAAAGTAASRVVSRDDRIGTAPYRTERLAQATLTTPSRGHAYRAVSAARSGSTYLVAAASPATLPLPSASPPPRLQARGVDLRQRHAARRHLGLLVAECAGHAEIPLQESAKHGGSPLARDLRHRGAAHAALGREQVGDPLGQALGEPGAHAAPRVGGGVVHPGALELLERLSRHERHGQAARLGFGSLPAARQVERGGAGHAEVGEEQRAAG